MKPDISLKLVIIISLWILIAFVGLKGIFVEKQLKNIHKKIQGQDSKMWPVIQSAREGGRPTASYESGGSMKYFEIKVEELTKKEYKKINKEFNNK